MIKKDSNGFQNLEVYQLLFSLMKVVIQKVVPKLPVEEKFDLAQQMRRACKAPPALLAEGYAKRYQQRHWRKYLDDCIGECNEMATHIQTVIAVYPQYYSSLDSLKVLVDQYDKCARQLTKLKKSWQSFNRND